MKHANATIRRGTIAGAIVAMLALGIRGAFARPTVPVPEPSYVGAIGPMHGDWTVDGKPATLGEPVLATTTIARNGARGASGIEPSITVYLFDGRLQETTCPVAAACENFGIEALGDTTATKPVMLDGTSALVRYRVPAVTPPPEPGIAPTDTFARLRPDGTIDLAGAMLGVPIGAYRFVLRPLDPRANYAAAGDPLIKLFSWTGDPVSAAAGGVPEGLYSAQLFARDAPQRALGASAWVAVLGLRADAATAGFASARALCATWHDDEAARTFLRAYLAGSVLKPTPSEHDHDRDHDRERRRP